MQPRLYTCFLWPTRVLNPNDSSIGSAVLRSSWQSVPILYNGPPFPPQNYQRNQGRRRPGVLGSGSPSVDLQHLWKSCRSSAFVRVAWVPTLSRPPRPPWISGPPRQKFPVLPLTVTLCTELKTALSRNRLIIHPTDKKWHSWINIAVAPAVLAIIM